MVFTPNENEYPGNRAAKAAEAAVAELEKLTSELVVKTLSPVTQFVATPGTGEALVASETFARAGILQARRASADNAGDVYVSLASDSRIFKLKPDGTINLKDLIGDGVKIDLSTIYIDADVATDGVVGMYTPV